LAAITVGDALVGPANPLTSAPRTSQGRNLKDVKHRNGKKKVAAGT
jgi:hypothetical protein